jgi:hypothetical protein
MLLAIPLGILLGVVLGGRTSGLAALRFQWPGLAIAGLLVQVVLFTPTGDDIAGAFGPTLYVLSTAAVFIAVLRNVHIPGMWIVAVGALSNLVAITANGGAMPADPAALETAGFANAGDHTNSVVLANPALRPLTDIFALPGWVPFANVYSVGDVLIGAGIVVVIVVAMRASRSPGAARSGLGPREEGSAAGS